MKAWEGFKQSRWRAGGINCYFSEEEFTHIQKAYVMQLLHPLLAHVYDGELFLEKTPSHALFLPEILRLFPQTRIIHLLRDPRDTVASLLAVFRCGGSNWATDNPNIAAHKWLAHVSAARSAAKSIATGQFLEVRYEDLHRAPLSELQRCMEFLRLNWSRADMADAVKANEPQMLAVGGGTPISVRGEAAERFGENPVEPVGFIRRAKVGSWRRDLSSMEKFWVWLLLRKKIGEFGYHWNELRFLNPLADAALMARRVLRDALTGR